jgi:RimJ/RimL family protein N-acetyltransferase
MAAEAAVVESRPISDADVDAFFTHRCARGIANLSDRNDFIVRWRRQRCDELTQLRTIVVAGQPAGYIAQFVRNTLPEVCYELGPQFWGNGFATAALRLFLQHVEVRPLYARVARDNQRSLRVLQRNGFSLAGEDRFLNSTGEAVEEFVFVLDGAR